MTLPKQIPDFSNLAEKWPSVLVAREETPKFSGGVLTPKTLANLDGKGLGPKGRFRIGRKVVYPVQSLIDWLQSRATKLD
jgi:hypothetical protein